MACKQSVKGFTLNCTLPHFYLCDYIAQTITTNYILQNFVGGITPFLGPSGYFRRASLTDHHFSCCACCGRNAAKATIFTVKCFLRTFDLTEVRS